MKRIVSALLLLAALLRPAGALAEAKEAPTIEVGGMALMEVNSGRLLAEQNAHKRLPMASTTKIMTALLAIEHCSLDEMVTVPTEAHGVEGSSMYLNDGRSCCCPICCTA